MFSPCICLCFDSVEVPLNVLKALNDVHALALQPLIPVIFPTLLPLVSAVLTRGVVRPLVTSVITTALLGTPLLQLAPKLSRTLITTLAHEGNIVELLDELKVGVHVKSFVGISV